MKIISKYYEQEKYFYSTIDVYITVCFTVIALQQKLSQKISPVLIEIKHKLYDVTSIHKF
jgi:5-bromo-4-chloroindolyl phosphate hydrolysis protein